MFPLPVAIEKFKLTTGACGALSHCSCNKLHTTRATNSVSLEGTCYFYSFDFYLLVNNSHSNYAFWRAQHYRKRFSCYCKGFIQIFDKKIPQSLVWATPLTMSLANGETCWAVFSFDMRYAQSTCRKNCFRGWGESHFHLWYSANGLTIFSRKKKRQLI